MWESSFSLLARRIREALGAKVRLLEHVGSTSVRGLAAKPVIDIVLAVADSTDESSYVPFLERHGFSLRLREPEWFEHRLFKCPDVECNLHVFSDGCDEIERMTAFRDRLRACEQDRREYEDKKRELAARSWPRVQDYADAKTDIVRAILSRARAGFPSRSPIDSALAQPQNPKP
jgi:GrpB-like predicted nucleotidyltransferase (UPF0157 family)